MEHAGRAATVPRTLRTLTLVHALLDGPFGAVLLVSPKLALAAIGLTPDPLFARIYGAALLGVAYVSVRVRDEDVATYRVVLAHKLAWGGCAMIACAIAALETPRAAIFGAVFAAFSALWLAWLVRLRRP